MADVTIQRVTRQFGTQVILQDVSLELQSGQVAGLIGANGSGKTTLFRLIAGELEPDLGTVTRARGLEIGFLRQELDFSVERSLHEEVSSALDAVLALESRLHELSDEMASCEESDRLAELMEAYERINSRFITAGGHSLEARLNEILGGLGFSREDYDRPMSILSGGQKCRAALAKLLLVDKPFLLLDEPTNHLDIDAVRWLEKFLAGHHGGVVVISHDRYLLDRLCDRIIELEATKVVSYPGNYSNYAKTKGVRRLTQERSFERDSEFIKKERAFIAKHIAGQRTKEAQGRRKRLERRIANGEFVTEAPSTRREVKLSFRESDADSITVLRCDELGMAFDSLKLFGNLTFQIPGSQRFGITGPNGTGKTTLLRILLGELTPTSGTYDLDPKLSVGYYSQEHVVQHPERNVLEEVRAAAPHLTEQDARTLLGTYLFRGDDVFKRIGSLSGGEQSRVRLLKLIIEQPDVLILDEPTNHLDIPSRESLEEALSAFAGTIIVVSHDRYFLDRIVDRLLVIRRSGHALYDGNYSYYIKEEETLKANVATPPETRRGKSGRVSVPRKPSGSKPSPLDPLPIEEIEALLIVRETRLAELQAQFGDPEIYKNPDRLAELRRQVEIAKREFAEVDEAWQHRADTQ